MLQLGYRTDCAKNKRLLIDRSRNVDFSRTSNAQFFYPCLKSGALHRDTEILVVFQSRISDECMIVRPGPAIALAYLVVLQEGPPKGTPRESKQCLPFGKTQ